MIYIPVILFVLLPFSIGWGIQSRFWTFKTFRILRTKAREFDNEKIIIEGYLPDGILLSKLRKANDLGDKTVIAHHLINAANDIVEKIFYDFCLGTLVIAGFLVFAFATQPQPPPTLWEWTKNLFASFAHYWEFPAGEFIFVCFAVHSAVNLNQQINKYREVLKLDD